MDEIQLLIEVKRVIERALGLYQHPVFTQWAHAWLKGERSEFCAIKAHQDLVFVPYTARWRAAYAAVEAAVALSKQSDVGRMLKIADYWIFKYNN